MTFLHETERRHGDVLLTLRGERGAVQAVFFCYQGRWQGLIGLHPPEKYGWCLKECEVLAGGACYADTAYRAGQDLVEQWDAAGQSDDVVWPELEDWYRTRFEEG
jgi:hypothetical protein